MGKKRQRQTRNNGVWVTGCHGNNGGKVPRVPVLRGSDETTAPGRLDAPVEAGSPFCTVSVADLGGSALACRSENAAVSPQKSADLGSGNETKCLKL
ncbi:hypothetical protein COCON_G00069640 [Conger conger]|uniref:Uncharacterized protein n=1 Tax=Conger conger TaxID=82655 RepID=A0A9Q1DT03_CONCO|nr:hypothetical protein COCON_G00069640 [Conger conger]